MFDVLMPMRLENEVNLEFSGKSKIKKLFSGFEIECPKCASFDGVKILSVEYENYIYDLINSSPDEGAIIVEIKRKDDEFRHEIKADPYTWNISDYINGVTYSINNLKRFENKADQIGISFKKSTYGQFHCIAYYGDRYLKFAEHDSLKFGEICGGTISSYGFEFSEIFDYLTDLKVALENRRRQELNSRGI